MYHIKGNGKSRKKSKEIEIRKTTTKVDEIKEISRGPDRPEKKKMRLHHAAIIVSSETGIDFYKDLRFEEVERQQRENDQIIWLKGNCCTTDKSKGISNEISE